MVTMNGILPIPCHALRLAYLLDCNPPTERLAKFFCLLQTQIELTNIIITMSDNQGSSCGMLWHIFCGIDFADPGCKCRPRIGRKVFESEGVCSSHQNIGKSTQAAAKLQQAQHSAGSRLPNAKSDHASQSPVTVEISINI